MKKLLYIIILGAIALNIETLSLDDNAISSAFFAIPSTSNAVVVSRTQPTQLHQTKSVQITNSEGEKTGLYNQQEQKATMDNGYEYHVTISNHNPTTTPITPKKGEELIGYRKNPEYKKGMMGSAKQFEMYGTLSSKKTSQQKINKKKHK